MAWSSRSPLKTNSAKGDRRTSWCSKTRTTSRWRAVIIGKEDKPNRPEDSMFGRRNRICGLCASPAKTPFTASQLKTDKFSTKFHDWIETDLLKLNPWDIAGVNLHDYSVIERRELATGSCADAQAAGRYPCRFSDKDGKWTLKDLTEYKGKKPEAVKLANDEELDA